MTIEKAKTYAIYYGKELYVPELKLTRMCDADFLKQIELGLEDTAYYPILKTSRDLVDDMLDKHYEFDDPYNLPAIFLRVIEMLKIGYLAIENKESPTGYVDLFGMPCVTPQMVEEGWKL